MSKASPLPVVVVLVACGPMPPEPEPADPPASTDAGPRMSARRFAGLADGVGRRTDREVAASGEARLGADDALHAWARLDPAAPARGRGAYLIEDGAKVWLVTFETDGRTEAWTGARGARAIEHVQFHHHGSETVVFALRGGEPAVLAYELIEDDDPEASVRQQFARDGVCVTPCPPLRGFDAVDARFEVVGPAADVAALTR